MPRRWWDSDDSFAPAPLPAANTGAASAVHDGILWVFGGTDSGGSYVDTVRSYDPEANAWTTHPDLPSARGPWANAAIIDGIAFIIDWDAFFSYDLATGATTDLEEPPGGYDWGHHLVAHSGLIYWRVPTGEPVVYDPDTDSWDTITAWDAVFGTFQGGEATTDGTYLYAMDSNAIGRYDPSTDEWSTLTPSPEDAQSVNYSQTVVMDGSIYRVGGWDGTAYSPAFARYDISADAWEQLDDLPTARIVTSIAVIDGRLFIAGGEDDGGALAEHLMWAEFPPEQPGYLLVQHTAAWRPEATLDVTWTVARGGSADASSTLRVVHNTVASVSALLVATHNVTPAAAGSAGEIEGTGGQAPESGDVPDVGPTITGSIEERVGAGIQATLEAIGSTPPAGDRADFRTTRVSIDGTLVEHHVGRTLYSTDHETSWGTQRGVPVASRRTTNPSTILGDTTLGELVLRLAPGAGGLVWTIGEESHHPFDLGAGLGSGNTASEDDCAVRDDLDDLLRPTRMEVARAAVEAAGMALVTLGSIPNAGRHVDREYSTSGMSAGQVLADMLLASNPRVWYTPKTVTVDARLFEPVTTLTPVDDMLPAEDRADDGITWDDRPGQSETEPVLADYTERCDRLNPDEEEESDEDESTATFETLEDGTYEWTERSGTGDDLQTVRNAIRKANDRVVEEVTETRGRYRLNYDSSLTQFGVVAQEVVTSSYHPDCPEALTQRLETTQRRKTIEDIPNVSNTVGTSEDAAFNASDEQAWLFDALPTWWVQESKETRQFWHAEGWLRSRHEVTRSLDAMIASPTFDADDNQDGYDVTLTFKTETRVETYIPVGNGLWWVRVQVDRTEAKPVYEPINPDAVEGDDDYGVLEVTGTTRQPTQQSYTEVTDRAPPSVSCGDDPCESTGDRYADCITEQTRQWEIDHADWEARQRHDGPKRVWSVTANRLLPEYALGQEHAGGIIASLSHERTPTGGATTMEVWQWLA